MKIPFHSFIDELKKRFLNAILRLVMFLRAIVSWVRYAILRIVPIAFFRIKKNNSETIVSLTTTPARISKIAPTIKSLIHQSTQPKAIILNIPMKSLKGVSYQIPKFLTKHPSITIQRCEDLGPATKLLPTLNKFEGNDVAILVVDDDQIYPRHLVKNYDLKQVESPKTALCLCGWSTPQSLDHKDRITLRGAGLKFLKPTPNISVDTSVDIVQGASSYLVKPSFFNDEVFALTESAFAADDIWISGLLAKNKVSKKVIVIKDPYCRQSVYNGFAANENLKTTLNLDNNHNNVLYKYFEPFWTKNSEG